MDPAALEKAFERYPEVRAVVMAHLYGMLGKIDELWAICDYHKAVIIEDAAGSLGASYRDGRQESLATITPSPSTVIVKY